MDSTCQAAEVRVDLGHALEPSSPWLVWVLRGVRGSRGQRGGGLWSVKDSRVQANSRCTPGPRGEWRQNGAASWRRPRSPVCGLAAEGWAQGAGPRLHPSLVANGPLTEAGPQQHRAGSYTGTWPVGPRRGSWGASACDVSALLSE